MLHRISSTSGAVVAFCRIKVADGVLGVISIHLVALFFTDGGGGGSGGGGGDSSVRCSGGAEGGAVMEVIVGTVARVVVSNCFFVSGCGSGDKGGVSGQVFAGSTVHRDPTFTTVLPSLPFLSPSTSCHHPPGRPPTQPVSQSAHPITHSWLNGRSLSPSFKHSVTSCP